MGHQAASGLASQGEADRFQPAPECGCPPLVGKGDRGEALAKGLSGAGAIQTPEAPPVQVDADGEARDREVREEAGEEAVDALGALPTVGAFRPATSRGHINDKVLLHQGHVLKPKCRPLRKNG